VTTNALMLPEAGTEVLRLSGVRVAYPGRQVLDGIDLSLGAGEFCGVIGPNGAGKTTLFRVILGMVRPLAGEVLLAGERVRRGSRYVGYVPQQFAVQGDAPLRARDLVALGLDGERWGFALPSRERSRRIDEMLERVGALPYAEANIRELSGGEQQRLLIALALLSDPKLLLLDEPLSNLDIRSAHAIVQLVRDLSHERKVAVLLVAHDINPLLGAMDQVLYLAGGRAAKGTVDEVVQPEVLSGLYGYRVDVVRAHGRILVMAGEDGVEAALPDDHDHHEHRHVSHA
jgi:zinc/manganese transport system ATP-binding protein